MKGEEYTHLGSFERLKIEQVVIAQHHLTPINGVAGSTGQYIGQGRLAGTIRPHNGVYFPCFDCEVEAFEDGLGAIVGLNAGVQI